MTQLLVSVRDAQEAQIALDQGVDLIDVKEPLAGPLGAARVEVIESIAAYVAGRVPLSAALGELLDGPNISHQLNRCVQYAKFGLAGCGSRADWGDRWRLAIDRLSSAVQPVAVVYADWKRADAPPPRAVLRHAAELGCRTILVDTFDKRHGSLLASFTLEDVARFIGQAQASRMLCVLAGSLGRREIQQLLPLGPDVVAVRGAACRDNRGGPLDPARVRQLAQLVGSEARLFEAPAAD
jgi:(5-formylfuran-3-yl)methyl phosphate synthase